MKNLLLIILLTFAYIAHGQVVVEGNTIQLQPGTYTIKVNEKNIDKPVTKPTENPIEKPVVTIGCGCGKNDFEVSVKDAGQGKYAVSFDACNVSPLNWEIVGQKYFGQIIPTSGTFLVDLSDLSNGFYQIKLSSPNCNGVALTKFEVVHHASGVDPPVVSQLPEPVFNSTKVTLQPIKDYFLPKNEFKSETKLYELKYIESEPDDHLNLKLEEIDGQLFISDVGNSLRSVSYTLNNWTDLENCGKLDREPIKPYRRYHLAKYSVDAPSIIESWKAQCCVTPRANYRRSELFFYVVPQGDTWNYDGESNNPIGRPRAFSELPPFKLTNRVYGFEYEFADETEARKNELDIKFNRLNGSKHLKVYAADLRIFIDSRGLRKGFHDFTKEECEAWADILPTEHIVAIDIEPGGDTWIIDYTAPNYARNMAYVVERLKQRGVLAYSWMDAESPNNVFLEGKKMGIAKSFGINNQDIELADRAYDKLGEIQKRQTYEVISTGYGYNGYDYNLSPSDGYGQNVSPQLTYLKSLDASELWGRMFPDKPQVYFSWGFMEFDFVHFPPNHIVQIPWRDAVAKRTDNKPLYDPSAFKDNLILGLLTSKYLFYWSPGNVGWNADNVSTYNSTYEKGFSVWSYLKGITPQTNKAYIGKESMVINSTIEAAYVVSLFQKALDGKRFAPSYVFSRQGKDGRIGQTKSVNQILNGSWYTKSLLNRQPFALIIENNGEKVVLFQDVWSRPGRSTHFEFNHDGTTYVGDTEGNRLFIAKF